MLRPAVLRGALCALALCACGLAAAAGDAAAQTPLAPASLADLPRLGAESGAPVMTVDGRVCAFPWVGADGVSHSTCAPLPASSAGPNAVWCKDSKAMWGICAAPPQPAATTTPGQPATTAAASLPTSTATGAATASLPFMPGAAAGAAASVASSLAPAAGIAAASQVEPAQTVEISSDFAAASISPAPAAAAVAAPTAASSSSSSSPPAQSYSLGPLRDSKGPVKLDGRGQSAVLRLRSQLADAQAAQAKASDEQARSAAGAKVRFVQQQLAAVQAGFLDPSAVGGGGDAAAPQCNGLYRQCGGLQPGSNTEAWQGNTACCGNSTCVQTDPYYAQCVPLAESRSRGCGAVNAQCAGDFWAGPWCCATNLGCMWESKAFSKCQTCNAAYAQCGGFEPNTSNKWARSTCCVANTYCKWINNGFSQCVNNGS